MRPADDSLWRVEASRILKAQLARQGLSYGDLVKRLNASGASESYAGVANKISRGSFTFAFYLQCIHALEHNLQDSETTPLSSHAGSAT